MSALDRIFEQAAQARTAGVRQPTDRPSQRRCAEATGSLAAARTRSARMQLRAASTSSGLLQFTGYASVYDRGYEMWDFFGPYTEQVSGGAGTDSLANPELDVPLVLAHDSLRRIARTTNGTLQLSEDDIGLLVDAPSLDPKDADVAYIAPKLESGLVDEMSFRFMITSGEWSPDFMEYHIQSFEIDRGDVAIVGYGANPFTAGSGLRGKDFPSLAELTEARLRELERDLARELTARGEHRQGGLDTRSAPAMTFAELDRIDRQTLIAPVI